MWMPSLMTVWRYGRFAALAFEMGELGRAARISARSLDRIFELGIDVKWGHTDGSGGGLGSSKSRWAFPFSVSISFPTHKRFVERVKG